MNKQTVIAALERLKDGTQGVVAATISDCQRVISTMDDDSGWISVTERMPDEHESVFARFYGTYKWTDGMFRCVSDEVIACVKTANGKRFITALSTHDGKWFHKVFSEGKEVTHWRPFPELPKEENNG